MEVVANQQLDWAERLWRYFKTERFVSLMDTGTLYFASARQFEDRFEGAVAVLPPGFPVEPTSPQFYERAFEELRRLTKVSCWHRAEYESDAMWQLYAGSRKGVAVRTTPDRIRAAAQPFRLKPEYGQEDLLGGHVNYADLLKERLNVSMAERFWYKHLAFSWEREFRLAVSMRMAEEFGVAVPEFGIHVEFDLDVLVDKIYLGPSLIDEEIAVIRASADQRGLGDRVRISSLRGQPRYT